MKYRFVITVLELKSKSIVLTKKTKPKQKTSNGKYQKRIVAPKVP